MTSNLVTPNKRSQRVSRSTSETKPKNKLSASTSEDPSQPWTESPESASGSSKSLKTLMGPPLGKTPSSAKSIKQSPSETSPQLSLSTIPSKDDQVDISPESSLLPVFKEVTRYTEGARDVCFVNFDRFPGPGRPGVMKSSVGVMEAVSALEEEDLSFDSETSGTSDTL